MKINESKNFKFNEARASETSPRPLSSRVESCCAQDHCPKLVVEGFSTETRRSFRPAPPSTERKSRGSPLDSAHCIVKQPAWQCCSPFSDRRGTEVGGSNFARQLFTVENNCPKESEPNKLIDFSLFRERSRAFAPLLAKRAAETPFSFLGLLPFCAAREKSNLPNLIYRLIKAHLVVRKRSGPLSQRPLFWVSKCCRGVFLVLQEEVDECGRGFFVFLLLRDRWDSRRVFQEFREKDSLGRFIMQS